MKKKSLILVTICVIIATLVLFDLFVPFYRVKDRKSEIKKFKADNVSEEPLGWVRVQGTNIDFPIIYYDAIDDIGNPDNDMGWSFENNRKLVNRTVIFSHNMRNVSSKPLITEKSHRRFEQLMSFVYYDFVKKNKYIQYTINNHNYLFKIYSVRFQKEENLEIGDISNNEKKTYIENASKNSIYDFNVKVSNEDKLLTLVTCTRFFKNADYSFVIDARKVRKNELVKNYSVKKNHNYVKIQKNIEGDDKDE